MMVTRKTPALVLLLALILVAAPAIAIALPIIGIDDHFENIGAGAAGFRNSGNTADATPTTTPETQTTAGNVALDGYYYTTAARPAATTTLSFNINDPASEGGGLSDTWQLTFYPITSNPNFNMRVIANFYSDSLGENGTITLLTTGTVITITETGHAQYLTTTGYSTTPASIYGAQFDFNSDVSDPIPEPATMLLLGSGLIGLAAYGRKKFFRK